jgi:aminopeptidase N
MGGIAIDDPRIRYALENQTRPIYSSMFFSAGGAVSRVIAHELAHQWFGDSVSVDDWSQTWLNEGFATYAEWLWTEHEGGQTPEQAFNGLYQYTGSPIWKVPPGDPGAADPFHASVYERGGMTLQALRVTVGDSAFFEILRTWAAQMRDRNATTAEFVALAERISGKQLDNLFQAWLYDKTRPPRP